MIEAHDLDIDGEDYTSRMMIGQNEQLLDAIRKLNINVERFANYAPRQSETIQPTQTFLSATPFQTTVQLRTVKIVISVNGATAVGLVVGTLPQFTFNFSAAGTFEFPYLTLIGRGQDLFLTVTGGSVATAYLISYPE